MKKKPGPSPMIRPVLNFCRPLFEPFLAFIDFAHLLAKIFSKSPTVKKHIKDIS